MFISPARAVFHKHWYENQGMSQNQWVIAGSGISDPF